MALCGLGATLLLPGTVQAQQDRVSVSEKGSLVIWPKIELRWAGAGGNWQLIQNTILSLTNDRNAAVNFQGYYVNGDPELLENEDGVNCLHFGWNSADVGFLLTANQAVAWSAASGEIFGGAQIGNFRALDNCFPPGRPDPEGSNERVLRGFFVGWAVDEDGNEINHNHLKGEATIINYRRGAAWEYSTYNHQAIVGSQGDELDDGSSQAGELEIGSEYSPAYNSLLLNFISTGSNALTSNQGMVAVDTDLTLMPMDMDLRQGGEPVMTKATITVWNSDEIKLSELDRCIYCWDQSLVSNYGIPNWFLNQNLGTDFGKARFEDTASIVCDINPNEGDVNDPPFPFGPGDVQTVLSPLVGVYNRQMTIDADTYAYAGSHLIGSGTQSATIWYTPPGDSEPLVVIPETPAEVVEWVDRQVRRGVQR